MTPPATVVRLEGDATQRGHAQAREADVASVRTVIAHRLGVVRRRLECSEARAYLTRQRRFAEVHCGEEMAEVAGIADGFGLPEADVFTFLHLGVLADVARRHERHHGASPDVTGDGCSVWAIGGKHGAIVGKNRDFHGEQAGVQRLFLHADPAWGGRRVLCIGSLGAPGAYSSGINSDGLAIADTQVATTDHGPGWLRYFTMTRVLRRHARVADALDDIRALQHAGGGTLVLGDAGGAVAAVDLGHRQVHVEEATNGPLARTNHYERAIVANTPDSGPMRASSEARLARLHMLLATAHGSGTDTLQGAMASHDGPGQTGLCRHGQDGDSRTLSASVFDCAARTLRHAPGNPCGTPWTNHGFGSGGRPPDE